MLKVFPAQKIHCINFYGWSQPQKLNTDHTLYITSTVGTATMDTLRSLEKERREAYHTRNSPTKSLSSLVLKR